MYVPCQVGESLLHINHALMIITNLRWLEACSTLYFEGTTGNFHQVGTSLLEAIINTFSNLKNLNSILQATTTTLR